LTDAITAAQNMRNEVAKCRQEAGDEYKKSKDQKESRWPVINFLRNLFEPQPSWVVDSYAPYLEKLQKQLALTCGTALKHLTQVWEKEDNTDLFEAAPRGNKEQQTQEPKEKPDTQLAEQFVCLFYLNFILRVIFRMRTLLMSAAGIYVFVLFSFSSYPFEPRSSFHVIMIILFFLVVGTVGVVLAQMHRNGTLSRITNTVPGELGMDFWLRLSAFIAVPLFSLLAAQFPGVVGTLSSWLESLQSFK